MRGCPGLAVLGIVILLGENRGRGLDARQSPVKELASIAPYICFDPGILGQGEARIRCSSVAAFRTQPVDLFLRTPPNNAHLFKVAGWILECVLTNAMKTTVRHGPGAWRLAFAFDAGIALSMLLSREEDGSKTA